MSRYRTPILTGTVACLAVWLGLQMRQPSESSSHTRPASAIPNSSPTQPSAIDPLASESNPATPPGTIEGETLLRFGKEAELDRFLAAAKQTGLRALAINRPLRAVRLETPNHTDHRRALDLAGPNANSEPNHIVLAPLPVLADDSQLGPSFEGNALDSMGVPRQNQDWGRGITIAVLDSGVLAHPSLSGVAIEHLDLVQDESDTPLLPHGTAVASLLAGQTGSGIAPAAQILSIRVLDSDGVGDSFTLAQGIVEAADRGAHIINMSLGSFAHSATLEEAVLYAQSKGVVLVASAGNEGLGLLPYPALHDGVIAVAAIDAQNAHAAFSNQGAAIDLAAPGVGLYAAWDEDKWVSFTGTSASAPLAAGAIAALASLYPDQSIAAAAERLLATANDTGLPGQDPQTGAGAIDLARALRMDETGIYDIAIADIVLGPDTSSGKVSSLLVTVQNRGTEPLPLASLQLSLPSGTTQTFNVGYLAPGAVSSFSHFLDSSLLASEAGYSLSAQVLPPATTLDIAPANNQKAATFHSAP